MDESTRPFVTCFGGSGLSYSAQKQRKLEPPHSCDAKILQQQYLKIFSDMGKDLKVDPLFIMAVALEESGWDLRHVYETNSSSNGQPLNNLFGATYGGHDNIPYSSVQASADAWEANWGKYLTNAAPKSIDDFVAALTSDPNHMYNANQDWKALVAGGTLSGGKSTPGTYDTLVRELEACNIKLP